MAIPRPTRIQAALFDFDGTLADTERLGIELDDEAYAHFGITPTQGEKNSLAGTDGLESIPALFRAHGMDVSAAEFFARSSYIIKSARFRRAGSYPYISRAKLRRNPRDKRVIQHLALFVNKSH